MVEPKEWITTFDGGFILVVFGIDMHTFIQ